MGSCVRAAGLRFVEAGIVHPADQPAFLAAALRARQRRDAAWPEVLFIIVGLFGAWFLTVEQLGGLSSATWHAIWTLFLRDVSRLRLNLLATNADTVAGMGFLGVAHVWPRC